MEDGVFIDPSRSALDAQRFIFRKAALVDPEGLIDAAGGVEIGEAVQLPMPDRIADPSRHVPGLAAGRRAF